MLALKFSRFRFSSLTGSLIIKNLINPKNEVISLKTPYKTDLTIDGKGLLYLPNLYDPHVHFRTPGLEHKEDWITGSRASFKGGITTVFDMPNVIPPTTTLERLNQKFSIIDSQLRISKLPLDYKLFIGVEEESLNEIEKVKDYVVGIKIFMTTSSSKSFMHEEKSLHAVYELASKYNLLVASHAEDHDTIVENMKVYEGKEDMKYHSCVHSKKAATIAVERIIKLAEIYKVKSYLLHMSTREEIELISEAKTRNVPVFAECCPHHLFLDVGNYNKLNGKAKMNPPVREEEDKNYMWEALNSGKIDIIGSDHAPHTEGEKVDVRTKCPSGVPGIETTLPLLLTAWKQKKISLDTIIKLMHHNPLKIFNNLKKKPDDFVLVNVDKYKILKNSDLATKVKWSPFAGMELTGFPKYVFTKNQLYDCDEI
jgi:dihydroorotase